MSAVPAGLLLAAAFWREGLGVLCWAAFVPFFICVLRSTPRGAFLWGWLFGAAAWAAGVPWLVGTLRGIVLRFPLPAALVLYAGFCAFHGLQFALLAWFTRRFAPTLSGRWKSDGAALALTAAPAALALEAFFPRFFPFMLAETQLVHLPTVQSLDLVGPGGVLALLIGVNAALCGVWQALRERRPVRWGFPALMAALVLANEAYGLARIRSIDALSAQGRPLKAALVQPALPARNILRREALAEENLAVQDPMTREALSRSPLDLIVWPEATYGRRLSYVLEGGERREARLAGAPLAQAWAKETPYPVPLLMNEQSDVVVLEGGRERTARFNSSFLLAPPGRLAGVVDKERLFPFGEFVPFGETFPILNRVNPRAYHLTRGEPGRLLELEGKARLGVLNCYEDFFRGPARRFALRGADLLINQSNDVWFGGGLSCEQHLRAGVLRAVENRRPLLRAVNVGVSAVVDPVGRVAARLDPGVRSVLVADVVPIGPRTLYSRLGDALYWLGAFLLPVLAWAGRDP